MVVVMAEEEGSLVNKRLRRFAEMVDLEEEEEGLSQRESRSGAYYSK